MGAIDLVIQVESPRSVSRGLQRVGRAGHRRDAVSRGRIFPTHRGDLAECAAVVADNARGAIEATRVPSLPLDVLAQQIVAICAERICTVDELHALGARRRAVRRASRDSWRVCWTCWPAATRRRTGRAAPARGVGPGGGHGSRAGRRAAPGGAERGTIPDQGLYAVVLPDGARVGELDEEMVYEARSGQTFTLGASPGASRRSPVTGLS